tara:strand:+ start:42 stop:305 length:264 start_codon:yes stop_codon:yes gene_type:complete
MKNIKTIVKTSSKSYPIYIGNNNINITGNLISKKMPNAKKVCIIVDKNLPSIFLKKLKISLKNYNIKIYKLTVNEKIKNFKIAHRLI